MIRFSVGWPPRVLNPNARVHWSKKSRAARAYRMQCRVFAHNALLHQRPILQGRMVLELVFRPPDQRRRDDDNLIAAFKAGRDGIADALSVDDGVFVTQFEVGAPIAGGAVEVAIYQKD